jgi:hypothetical protein
MPIPFLDLPTQLPLDLPKDHKKIQQCVLAHRQKPLYLLNSFGSDWANSGYCWITFDYAEAYFVDMWTFDVAVAY